MKNCQKRNFTQNKKLHGGGNKSKTTKRILRIKKGCRKRKNIRSN